MHNPLDWLAIIPTDRISAGLALITVGIILAILQSLWFIGLVAIGVALVWWKIIDNDYWNGMGPNNRSDLW